MYKGSLVTIEDLSNERIVDILDLAREIQQEPDAFYGLASRRIMASLFLEPSTRTRGSFESAMQRLGGSAITTADPKSSSTEKGESLADAIRIWSGYSDLIVLRHPWEGATRLAAEYSDVPVINAGDGSHEHPTQTLLDLYTLRQEFGTLQSLRIVLCGDLKNGRTVHSLTYALLRFGASVIFVPGEGLGLPEHVRNKIEAEYDKPIQEIHHPGLRSMYGEGADEADPVVDAIYMTPREPHSLTLFDSMELRLGKDESLAFYVTRKQVEREPKGGDGSKGKYPHINQKVMKSAGFSEAVILHPLPRLDELSPALDSDPRSKYFEQARNGVPVRMALIALMLGLRPWNHGSEGKKEVSPKGGIAISGPESITCINQGCVTQTEPQNTTPEFSFFQKPQPRFVCGYCEREAIPAFYRYPWGEVYYPIEVPPFRPLDPTSFGFFLDEASAQADGLRPPKRELR